MMAYIVMIRWDMSYIILMFVTKPVTALTESVYIDFTGFRYMILVIQDANQV
jgi:hypothetical protein